MHTPAGKRKTYNTHSDAIEAQHTVPQILPTMRANQIRKKFVVHTRIGEGEVEGEHVNVRAGPGSCRVGVSRQDKVRVEERERTTRAHTSALVLSMPIFPSLPLSLSILLPLLSFPLSRARAFDAPSLLFFLGAEFSLLFSAYCLARAVSRVFLLSTDRQHGEWKIGLWM